MARLSRAQLAAIFAKARAGEGKPGGRKKWKESAYSHLSNWSPMTQAQARKKGISAAQYKKGKEVAYRLRDIRFKKAAAEQRYIRDLRRKRQRGEYVTRPKDKKKRRMWDTVFVEETKRLPRRVTRHHWSSARQQQRRK